MFKSLARYFRRVHLRSQSLREGRKGTLYTLTYDSAGLQLSWLTLENEKGQSSFNWDEVQSIIVYKRDLFVVDQICAVFALSNMEALEIDEEMAGWRPLIECLPVQLPGTRPFDDWWYEVAVPAFAPNTRVIYQRFMPPAGLTPVDSELATLAADVRH